MESSRYDSDIVEIDLGEIVSLLWHKAWLIILSAVLAAVIGFGVSKFVITEKFESTTKIYILNKDSGGSITYSDMQLGSQLTKDYAQIIKSRHVLEQVINNCTLTEEYESFSNRIKVEIPTDTRMIYITVTDEDPVMAQYLANEIRKTASAHIENVMDIQAVNVVDEANLPISPASPSVRKWTMIGFLIGGFVCAAIVLIHFMLDDTVKTSDDVERYLGLSTLGMIPVREDADKQKHHKSSRSGGSGHSSGSGQKSGQRSSSGYESVNVRENIREKKSDSGYDYDDNQNDIVEIDMNEKKKGVR